VQFPIAFMLMPAASRCVLIPNGRSPKVVCSLIKIGSFLVETAPVSKKVVVSSMAGVSLVSYFARGSCGTAWVRHLRSIVIQALVSIDFVLLVLLMTSNVLYIGLVFEVVKLASMFLGALPMILSIGLLGLLSLNEGYRELEGCLAGIICYVYCLSN